MMQMRFFFRPGMALSAAFAVAVGLLSSVAIAGSPANCSKPAATQATASAAASSCPVLSSKASVTHVTMPVANCPAIQGCDYSNCTPDGKSLKKTGYSVNTARVWSAKGLLQHADAVGLTNVQEEKLKEIAANMNELSELSRSLEKAEKELADLMRSPEATVSQVEERVRAVESQRTQYRVAAFRHGHQIRSVVTPEQAQALAMITSPLQPTDSPNAIIF